MTTRTPQVYLTPRSAGDKFLALVGFLLAALIVYRVDRCGAIVVLATSSFSPTSAALTAISAERYPASAGVFPTD